MTNEGAKRAAAQNLAEMNREKGKIAASYKAVFESDSGKAVMADLLKYFNPSRPRFSDNTGFDMVKAAKIDGQSDVVNHIKAQLERANS